MQIAPSKEEKALNQLKFMASEKKGRDKTITILNNVRLIESEDLYSSWDFSGTSLTTFFLEVKNREILSTDYSTSILEVDKLRSIIKIAKENNAKAYYFTIYNDNKAFLFDLFELPYYEIDVELKEMNEKTATGYNYKKDKLVYLLPLSMASQTFTF